jgi:hypothetical protein
MKLSKEGSNLVFLIGAARSGTKMLRDVLAQHPGISKVPYDINFVWRWGNESLEHDELSPANYSDKNKHRIHEYLERYAKKGDYLIEKSVSNTIRIPFLQRNYPDAKYIFLYRNGIDVCESVIRQWKAPLDGKYLLQKMRNTPPSLLINYGMKFLKRNLIKRKNDFFWGVNFPGMSKDLQFKSIEKIVAQQWTYCVGKMLEARESIDSGRLIEIKYEDLVYNSDAVLERIFKFIDPQFSIMRTDKALITSDHVGRGKSNFLEEQLIVILPIVESTMKKIDSL